MQYSSGRQAQPGSDLRVVEVLEQGGLADAPLPDHRGALVRAGAQPVDDLADILHPPVEAGWVADGIAEGEGVSAHQISSLGEFHPIQVPEFDVIECHF